MARDRDSLRRKARMTLLSAFDHVLHHVDFSREDDYDKASEENPEVTESAQSARAEVADLGLANVISSAVIEPNLTWKTRRHTVALDIDFPCAVVESTTPGHCHLYIDKLMPWEDYEKLLKVCGEIGLVEEGYVKASIRRRATHLRLPWVRKVSPSPVAPRGEHDGA